MGGIIAGIVSGLVSVIPGLAQVIGNTIVKDHETQAAREADQNKSGVELTKDWLDSNAAIAKAKADSKTQTTIVQAFVLFAAPVGWLFWQLALDQSHWLPALHWGFFGLLPYPGLDEHVPGSWHVAAGLAAIPPEWSADVHMIIQSFFIAAPAIGGALALVKAFKR